VGAETVEVRDRGRVVARHERAVGKGVEVLLLDHYLEVFKLKPGALPGSTALYQARASGHFTEVHDAFYKEARHRLGDAGGTRAMVEVLLSHRSLPADAVVSGMRSALSIGSVDPVLVVIEARRSLGEQSESVVPIGSALKRFDRPAPSLSHYDELLEVST
jgi:hypothetical protein